MTSAEILSALADEWGNKWRNKRWLFLRELRVGTGHSNSQSIDAFVMDAYPSGGMYRTAFEVKVSRADFCREIRQPQKRREAMRYSNYFYFVAPSGMLKVEDIPIDCGLIDVSPAKLEKYNGNRYDLDVIVPATHRDVPGPTWTFMAAALRCQMKGRVSEIGAVA